MNDVKKKFLAGVFLGCVTLFLIAMYVTVYLNEVQFELTDVVVFVLLLTSWFHFFTWGADTKVLKDELGRVVSNKSASISYHVLTTALFVLWILDRILFVRKNEFGNEMLFVALCFALVIYPLIQLIVSKKYT